jgi:hypothetical protein
MTTTLRSALIRVLGAFALAGLAMTSTLVPEHGAWAVPTANGRLKLG